MDRPYVILVGHGSRDSAANDEFQSLVARYQARRADVELHHGYIELVHPTLAESLAAVPDSVKRVALLPLFLFAAGHVKHDVPRALAEARRVRPDVAFHAARPLGVDPQLVELVLARADECSPIADDGAARATTVVMVGRGASDPEAGAEFCKLAELVAEARPFRSVIPCFLGISRPRLDEALELAVRERPERLVIVPYFLFGGQLVQRARTLAADFAERFPWIKFAVAEPLGIDERLMRVMDARLDEVLRPSRGGGNSALACGSYPRWSAKPVGARQPGGLRALLWSLRRFACPLAAPGLDAYRVLAKRVLHHA